MTVQSKDGVEISIRKSGSGSALLLVHGAAATSLAWLPVLEPLNRHFTVYAMDRRGRPPSGDAPTYSLANEVDDLLAVTRAIAEPLTLVAHSYGAVATVAALDRLTDVRRLILYEPPIYENGRPEHERMTLSLQQAWSAGDRDLVTSIFLSEIMELTPAAVASIRELPAWQELKSLAATYPRESVEVDRFRTSAAAMRAWKAPTTMLLGSLSPAHMRQATMFVSSLLPNCRVVALEGQRHVAAQRAPDLFVSKILEACSVNPDARGSVAHPRAPAPIPSPG